MSFLKEVTPKSVFLVITSKKFFELPMFQLLKCILSREISFQRSPKSGINSHHFETNTQLEGMFCRLQVEI